MIRLQMIVSDEHQTANICHICIVLLHFAAHNLNFRISKNSPYYRKLQ